MSQRAFLDCSYIGQSGVAPPPRLRPIVELPTSRIARLIGAQLHMHVSMPFMSVVRHLGPELTVHQARLTIHELGHLTRMLTRRQGGATEDRQRAWCGEA